MSCQYKREPLSDDEVNPLGDAYDPFDPYLRFLNMTPSDDS